MGENFALDSAHNFGIYTKSGKRTIFQIDFSCKRINLIERGKIGKSFDFNNLEQYDSEENLHIVLRFRNNKSVEFDADTAEEKYTICRLLSIIIGAEPVDNIVYEEDYNVYPSPRFDIGSDSNSYYSVYDAGDNGVNRRPRLNSSKQVIKQGVLEKKGNTKIPTWSRRRLQVCPGEFSYYKPGEEVALNLVQLWENVTSVSRNGNTGFTVAVRDRAYHFKVLSEKGVNTEQERDNWINAFNQASQRKRTTFLLLEMSKKTNYNNNQGLHTSSSAPDFNDVTYYNTGQSRGSSSGSEGSSRELMEGLEDESVVTAINELDEVLEDEFSTPNKPRSIALSVVQKSGPMLASPTKTRARPPAIGAIKGSSFTSSQGGQPTYDYIPEPDYSPPSSPSGDRPPPQSHAPEKQASGVYANFIHSGGKDPRTSGVYATEIQPGGIQREAQQSGKYKTVISPDPEPANRHSGDYSRVIGKGPGGNAQMRQSGVYAKQIKAAPPPPGGVDVLPKVNEVPKLRKVGSSSSTEESDPKHNVQDDEQAVYENLRVDVKKFKDNIENAYYNDQNKLSPREKFPPPQPSKPRPAPPPPSNTTPHQPSPPSARRPPDIAIPAVPGAPPPPCPAVPAPPPFMQANGGPRTRGKLKQVHWSKTPKPLVANSIWERTSDRTRSLNLKLLEEQFAVKDVETPTTPGPKTSPAGKSNLLIDGKRAQNLGIFMAGLKNEGARKLVDILNSVTEDDSFPAEKLTTIRRLQPTEDEIDMYRAHADRRKELHPVDQFMLELCEIPHLSLRIDICLTLWDFPWQYDSTCQLVEQVHGACDELLGGQQLVTVLEYILAIGNHLNRNWAEDNVAHGFQITSLDKILDVRGRESGYTLTHFLVDQLRSSDPALLGWTDTVQTVKKCEQVSAKSVAAESEVLRGDLVKIRRHLKTLKSKNAKSTRHDNNFQQEVQNLVVEYELKLEKLDRRCAEVHTKYRRVLTKFGEPLYQKSDQIFAVIAHFADRFRSAVGDLEARKARKNSAT